jgi:signal peptidase
VGEGQGWLPSGAAPDSMALIRVTYLPQCPAPGGAVMRARNVGRFMWTSVSFSFMLLTMLLAAVLLVVPKTVDALPLTILTGSMRPAMPPGTLAVVQPTDPERLKVGDVVTYQWESGNPALVTHRVTQISRSSNGDTTLLLKGDNNPQADPPIQVEQVMGKVIYAVPYFGWVTNNINSDTGRKYTKWVAYGFLGYGAVTFLAGLIGLFRDHRGPEQRATSRSGKGLRRAARARRRSVLTRII